MGNTEKKLTGAMEALNKGNYQNSFDIFKPFPANWIDNNLKNSYGVILDDIVSAVYTILVLLIINMQL